MRNTGNATGSYSDNLSLTAIMSDTKKRLAQASRQYQRCNQIYGGASKVTAGVVAAVRTKGVERFYPMGSNIADGGI